MDSSIIVAIAVGCIIGLFVWLFFIRPAEREYDNERRAALNRQAAKRGGSVVTVKGRPMLHVRYEGVTIELSSDADNEELLRDHEYARFKLEDLADKEVSVLLDSVNPAEKPIVSSDRVHFADKRFEDAFVSTSNDQRFTQDLLTPEIRERLMAASLQLRIGVRTDSSRFSGDHGWISVFTRGLRGGDDLYDQMIETAIILYKRTKALVPPEPGQ